MLLDTKRFADLLLTVPFLCELDLPRRLQRLHVRARDAFIALQSMPYYPLKSHQVPPLFAEPYILNGFRAMRKPWAYYFDSLFHKHNETVNVWTHLLGIIYMLHLLFDYGRKLNFYENPHSWPFAVALCTAIVMFTCSAFAHLLHSKSESIHMTCFLIDFIGVSMHGFGSGFLQIYYCAPEWYYQKVEYQYIFVLLACGLSACFLNCFAQYYFHRPYPPLKRICQFFPCGVMWVYAIIPLCIRLYSSKILSSPALQCHLAQIFLFLLGAFLFGCDMPQRLCPGALDFIGQGHHLFHSCICLVTICQMHGVYRDLVEFEPIIHQRMKPDLIFCAGSMVLLIVCDCIIAFSFRRKIHERHHLD